MHEMGMFDRLTLWSDGLTLGRAFLAARHIRVMTTTSRVRICAALATSRDRVLTAVTVM